jgi:hypothetical protein
MCGAVVQTSTNQVVREGDHVRWTDPRTGAIHTDLIVEQVFKTQGSVRLRGCFGRFSRDGSEAVTQRLVRLSDCSVQPRAEAE